jgi:hypothetical protein
MSITVDVDLRPRLSDARDQRQRPTCLAFAASGAHEAKRRDPDYLSTEFLFFHGVRRSHRDPSRGIAPAVISAALEHDGQPIENAWQYLVDSPDAAVWQPPAFSDVCHRALLVFEQRTVAEVLAVLSHGRPVILISAVTLAMYSPNSDAVIDARPNDIRTAQRHALLAVGYGHSNDGAYVLVRNSWGLRWGDRGHCWLNDAYLDPLLITTGVLA